MQRLNQSQQVRKSRSKSLTDTTPAKVVVKSPKRWNRGSRGGARRNAVHKNKALCWLRRKSEKSSSRVISAVLSGLSSPLFGFVIFFSFTPPGSPPDDAVTSSAPRGYRQWTIHPAAGTSTVPAPSSCPRQVFTLRHSSYQIASRMRAEGSAWRLFNIFRLAVHLKMVNLAVGGRGGPARYEFISRRENPTALLWVSLQSPVRPPLTATTYLDCVAAISTKSM